jgi:aquaporin Z
LAEYLMEAAEAGLYLFSACAFDTLLRHPASPVQPHLATDTLRRMLMGLAMGATIIAIVLSPWGKQSGAHFDPAVTFTFYRLRKVASWDAVFYCAAQFIGAVRYAATMPGIYGERHRFFCRIGYLVPLDDRDPVRVQSKSPGTRHTLFCRHVDPTAANHA